MEAVSEEEENKEVAAITNIYDISDDSIVLFRDCIVLYRDGIVLFCDGIVLFHDASLFILQWYRKPIKMFSMCRNE